MMINNYKLGTPSMTTTFLEENVFPILNIKIIEQTEHIEKLYLGTCS